jgi:hypothetical protein
LCKGLVDIQSLLVADVFGIDLNKNDTRDSELADISTLDVQETKRMLEGEAVEISVEKADGNCVKFHF